MNDVYQMLNGNKSQNGVMTQFKQFTQNPIGFLTSHNVNIPQQYQSNPKEAVQHFLNNGQMSQNTYNKLMQTANSMGIKLS